MTEHYSMTVASIDGARKGTNQAIHASNGIKKVAKAVRYRVTFFECFIQSIFLSQLDKCQIIEVGVTQDLLQKNAQDLQSKDTVRCFAVYLFETHVRDKILHVMHSIMPIVYKRVLKFHRLSSLSIG